VKRAFADQGCAPVVGWRIVHRLVLAVDTSSPAVTAALVAVSADGCRVEAQREHIDARGHAEHLAPAITACLRAAGATPSDLAALVAGTGPGPYTGLRVGLVTAGVMADILDIPVYGVCSLDGIAGRQRSVARLLVAADARRKEIYWARYLGGRRTHGPQVDRPDAVPVDDVDAMTGAGARLYADTLRLPLLAGDYPDPAVLVDVARERIVAAAPSEPLTPLYLRRPDAELPTGPKAVLQ
jgi:tRNA threonylcarbamoyl adenosine modification protein YeaZ